MHDDAVPARSQPSRATPSALDQLGHPTHVTVRPWVDPLVDRHGHDPRSHYVELFWLGVLGPTATWLLRRLVAGLDHRPDGYEVDLVELAAALGLSYTRGAASPFGRAVQRCVMFGLAHPMSDGIAVRRRVPAVAQRHLRRLPEALQVAHDDWQRATIRADELDRARRLAAAMLGAGDDALVVEHQLLALGVAPLEAATAATLSLGGSDAA